MKYQKISKILFFVLLFSLTGFISIKAEKKEITTWVLQLTDSSLNENKKWEISRKIVAQGKDSIPVLIEYIEDKRVIGKTYPTLGECINLPPHLPPPDHCQKPSQDETLGDRSKLLLYQIITPIYTSPYTTRVSSKIRLGPPFVIKDWKGWWQKYKDASLSEIHEKARKLMDEFWLRGFQKGSVEWDPKSS